MASNDVQKTCRVLTLGCKVNQYESQHVLETLEANGYTIASPETSPDLIVVNTCTVTHEADAKARQLIRQLGKAHGAKPVVVMGCYATRDPHALRRLPNVVTVVENKSHAIEALAEFGVTKKVLGISRFEGHQRAFVKVQDGCLLNCSFCIIPSVRPAMRSRPLPDIVAEVERLVGGGCQEIVLTGIHLGHYGIDLSRGRPKSEWTRLWHLVEKLTNLPGDFRIRLSSLEAAECRDDLLHVLKGNPRVCHHLHLCLQSGSDRILRLMKRRYGMASFLERCHQVRQALDEPAITTDVIVGFPGETEADFKATCDVARAAGFAKMHVFPYSRRHGTEAATLPDQIHPSVLARRRDELLELDKHFAGAYLHRLVGKRLDLLVEGIDSAHSGWVRGTTCRKITALVEGGPWLIRKRVPVMATRVERDYVLATGIPEEDGRLAPAHRLALPLVS